VIEKYDRLAGRYREHDYADAARYFERKARLVAELAPRLVPGDTVLDYGCGDGALATPLVRRGLVVHGVDVSPGMVEAARRNEPRATFSLGSIDEYDPPEPVDCIVAMRSFYFASDRPAFFARARAHARKKLVFDFDPRVHPQAEIVAELAAAGFSSVRVRPFLMPQRHRLPAAVQSALWVAEPTPAARVVLRAGFPPRLLVTASV
jgi:SAM-dependent methyltransferase